MNEYDLIRLISKKYTKHKTQKNKTFTCDAEVLNLDGQQWAFTVDDFSPEEDFFITDNPELLGANLVTATISDIFAVGAKPSFFMQALSLSKNVKKGFVCQLTEGMKSILEKTNCAFCGGDIGTAETWRFTGVAFGKIINNKPLTRVLPNCEQVLWVTGKLGDANLAAFRKTQMPKFECRNEEANLIHQYATACIDTSGGLFDALWMMYLLNRNISIEVDLDAIPYSMGLKEFSQQTALPIETALMGGAGEYELLFAAPLSEYMRIQEQFGHNVVTPIGTVSPKKSEGIALRKNSKVTIMRESLPCPRAAENLENYIDSIVKFTIRLLNE